MERDGGLTRGECLGHFANEGGADLTPSDTAECVFTGQAEVSVRPQSRKVTLIHQKQVLTSTSNKEMRETQSSSDLCE